jgi:uncharacterized protein (DUF433 family)
MIIDWSRCPDVERSADTLSGAWRIKGTRIPVQAIIDNAEDCTPEEIAGPDIYPDLAIDVVRRILAFAGVKALDYSDIPPLDDDFFARAKPKALLTDETAPALEDQCRAYLAAHPDPPADAFERECWQAMKGFVEIADKLAARCAGKARETTNHQVFAAGVDRAYY